MISFRHDRMALLKLERDKHAATMRSLRPALAKKLPRLIDSLYDHLQNFPELKPHLSNAGNLARLKKAHCAHWLEITSGQLDHAYTERTRMIGKTLSEKRIDPHWYIGSYALTLCGVIDTVRRRFRFRPKKQSQVISTIVKSVFLDLDLALSIYDDESRYQYKHSIEDVAENLEDTIRKVTNMVSGAANSIQGTAETLAANAGQTSHQAANAAAASDQASRNVHIVAKSTEDLSAAITEILQQVSHSSEISVEALEEASRGHEIASALTEATAKIGDVTDLIDKIAGQTNLLALNAAIEAARAGEAGKGFGVVAGEVKNLASRTAKATQEIATHLKSIQDASAQSAEALTRIGHTIQQFSDIIVAINLAIAQQQASISDITRNLREAAAGTLQVSNNILFVTEAAGNTGNAAGKMLDTSKILAKQSQSLNQVVEGFLHVIRKAS